MPKPTVYVETTVIGHLVGRILADPIVAGRQMVTRNWWPSATKSYRFFVSRLVADECGAGDDKASTERLAVLDSLEFLGRVALVTEPSSVPLASPVLFDRRFTVN